MNNKFNGLGMNLGNLSKLSNAESFSISAENKNGEKGKGAMDLPKKDEPARELGQGWKCSPCITIKAKEVFEFANIDGSGAIQSMWFAGNTDRFLILRIYWENEENPSVEVPISDFFGSHWLSRDKENPLNSNYAHLNSIPVCVNPNYGLNCFWEMPFRKHCRMTLENIDTVNEKVCYYQINYTKTEVPDDIGYFHAQFRRVNPLPYKEEYVIVDNIKGQGHYIGTSMGWGINNNGWWGEGEIKFFIDGDSEFPTICGTGTEDYFGGAYNWDVNGRYTEYTTPYMGMHQVIRPDGLYNAQQRHGMYRWHVMDPIRFKNDLKVTIQALGWKSEGRFYPGQHDICSVAFWYQTLPFEKFPDLPDKEILELV